MGAYTFTWPHAAKEVYVTGTFDNWHKTIQLFEVDGTFKRNVDFPADQEKIYYKFVVDGEWTTDPAATTETDEHGNTNNVLHPRILTSATLSSVDPKASTVMLAAKVPLEKDKPAGAFEGDPVSAPGAPSSAIPSRFSDPRTIATAFHQDPLSPNDSPVHVIGDAVKVQSYAEAVAEAEAAAGAGNDIVKVQSHAEAVAEAEGAAGAARDSPAHDDTEIVKVQSHSEAVAEAEAAAGAAHGTPEHDDRGLVKVQSHAEAVAEAEAAAGTARAVFGAKGLPEAFHNDPVSAGGPEMAITSRFHDPRTVAAAFNQDPLSPNDRPAYNIVPDKSAGILPGASTAALAGQVPKEPRGTPHVVDEHDSSSRGAAGADGAVTFAANKDEGPAVTYAKDTHDEGARPAITMANETPAAGAGPQAVAGKTETERELRPTAPAATTSYEETNGLSPGLVAGSAVGGAGVVGGAGIAAAAQSKSGSTTPSGPNIVDEDTIAAIAVANNSTGPGEPPVVMTDRAGPLTDAPDPSYTADFAQPARGVFDDDPVCAPGAPEMAVPSRLADPRTVAAAFLADPISPDSRPAELIVAKGHEPSRDISPHSKPSTERPFAGRDVTMRDSNPSPAQPTPTKASATTNSTPSSSAPASPASQDKKERRKSGFRKTLKGLFKP